MQNIRLSRRLFTLMASAAMVARLPEVAEAKPTPKDGRPTLAELDEMAALEFENDDGWYKSGTQVAPADVDLKTMRGARATAIAKARADIVKREKQKEPRLFTWADDKDSIDYFHIQAMGPTAPAGGKTLSTAISTDPFDLTHDTLEAMVTANYFGEHLNDIFKKPSATKDGKIIFALRGATPVGDMTALSKSVRLKETVPDHRNYNCVIGVWDRKNKQVAAFTGSTVPLELHLALYQTWLEYQKPETPLAQRPKDQWKTNMMPQGLHEKIVATMWDTEPPERQLARSFKQNSATPVLRADTGDALTTASTWVNEWPGDHLHAGLYDVNKTTTQKFSSQGCQTVQGWYDKTIGKPWPKTHLDSLHTALGLADIDAGTRTVKRVVDGLPTDVQETKYTCKSDGTIYPFMMLSGREARLHAGGADMDKMRRVRIGSKAPAGSPDTHIVNALLINLGFTSGGAVTGDALYKLIGKQERFTAASKVVARDGILSPLAAHDMKIDGTF